MSTTVVPVRGRRRRVRPRETVTFLLLAGPNVALLLLFVYRPLVENIRFSTLRWTIGSAVAQQIGLANYTRWFADSRSADVLRTTLVFTVVAVAGGLVLGLGLALLLDRRLRGRTLVRTLVFAPYVVSGVAVGLCWLFVFDPTYGLLSAVLAAFGADSPDWYNDPGWALAMICVVYLWKNVGYVAVVYLAGLQSLPADVLEAARIDGAGPLRLLLSVRLPLLSPTTAFLLVTSTIASLQSFDVIRVMTSGGPLEGTTTLVYEVYRDGFVDGRAGYASAVAMLLFLVLLVLTAVQMLVVERRVHYR